MDGFEKKSKVHSEMQKSSMAKMDNRVFESATCASRRSNLRSNANKNQLLKGDVVLIQGDQKNRGR